MRADTSGPRALVTMLRAAAQALIVLVFAAAASAATAAASWTPAGNLATPRYGHSATLLKDGRVLVAGGRSDCCSNALSSAEIFDPVTRQWSVTGSMQVGRFGHAAALLQDGRVLVVGGATGAELYDPATGAWTATGSLATERSGFSLTVLRSGKVLVAGGLGPGFKTFASAEIFDPSTGQWSRTGDLVNARESHAAALLRDGRVLVVGGIVPTDIDNWIDVTTAELYDPVSGAWQLTSSPNRHYVEPKAALVGNGNVVILGDVGDTEQYDPAHSTWTLTGTRNVAPERYAATLLSNGQVLVAGGYDSRTVTYTAAAELYDGSTGAWSDTAPLATARADHTATLLSDGNVLVVGGTHPSVGPQYTLASAEMYQGGVASFAIGPGVTGSWYDPAQSGHGLFIEVLDETRLLAAWFTFDPSGTQQAWFVGVGTYSGNTATISAMDQPTGGRFIPNFDPRQVVHNPWGTLTFTFSDCNHGRVDFDSTRGYGKGSMDLTRLTLPAGLACP